LNNKKRQTVEPKQRLNGETSGKFIIFYDIRLIESNSAKTFFKKRVCFTARLINVFELIGHDILLLKRLNTEEKA